MAEDMNLAALRWQEAIDADRVDWGRFTSWLEADPAHREAFDAVSQIDAMLKRSSRAGEARVAGLSHDPLIANRGDHRPDRFSVGSSRYSTAKPM